LEIQGLTPFTIRGIRRWINAQISRYKTHPHRLAIECVILFLAGFLEDYVLSLDTIVTANRLWLAAGATSYCVVMLQSTVLYSLVDDRITAWPKIQSLAFGCATGAMLAVAFFPQ
jgi:hypothetical protein